MIDLPFCSVDEAKSNARSFCRELEFHSVLIRDPNGGPPIAIGLQRTQELMAKVYGFSRWKELASALEPGVRANYLGLHEEPSPAHSKLATKFARALVEHGFVDKIDSELVANIERALALSAFGRTLDARRFSEAFWFSLHMKFKSAEQFRKYVWLQAGYDYATRYPSGRSTYENEMLHWRYAKEVAKLMGDPCPAKPRRKKSNT